MTYEAPAGRAPGTRVVEAGRHACLATLVLVCAGCLPRSEPEANPGIFYFPGYGSNWGWLSPKEAGFDETRLQAAIDFAFERESSFGPDLESHMTAQLTTDPYGEIIGPVQSRGGPTGVIVRHGYRVAEWGSPNRVDMSFSITRSVLSTLVGLAWDRGMIEDLQDPVAKVLPEDFPEFRSDRNSQVTWEMLLEQRSEWEGLIWGKPDVADRLPRDRELGEPGSYWEFSEVRANVLAHALLHLWRFPLPDVLDQLVMEPIGATPLWEWHGYRNSGVAVAGQRTYSVAGGGRWGGGLWISARDLARLGYLFLRGGKWREEDLLSVDWIRLATSPSEIRTDHGYLWWLNTDRQMFASASEDAFFAIGAAGNVLWVEPQHDLVVVTRWMEATAVHEFMTLVLTALEEE